MSSELSTTSSPNSETPDPFCVIDPSTCNTCIWIKSLTEDVGADIFVKQKTDVQLQLKRLVGQKNYQSNSP